MDTHWPHLDVYGELPKNSHSERRQFERILHTLDQTVARRIIEFGVVAMHVDYKKPFEVDRAGSEAWKGEFDIVLFGPDRIFIYELKSGQTKLLYGRTDNRPWKLKRGTKVFSDRSWFDQASKQRYHLLRNFLNSARTHLSLPEPNHFVVDSRIICGDGSDLSAFYHKVPHTVAPDEYEKLISYARPADRELLRTAFSRRVEETGEYWLDSHRPIEIWDRLAHVWREAGLEPKTARWFKLLQEHQLAADLETTTSDRFRLAYEDARRLAIALQDRSLEGRVA